MMFRLPQAVAAVYDRRRTITAVTDRRYRLGRLLFALVFSFPLALAALDSEPAPLASRSLLLDVTRAGNRLVAVGDRGHILLSDDEGGSWRQVIVPTRAMLTGVSFGDDRHGWAVGHDGVILATIDGGQTWSRQDPGEDLETVFLDVYFSDPLHGLTVGAYGKGRLTIDGGKSWQPASPVPDEVHINQAAAADDTLYLAGESGTLLVSTEARNSWPRLALPYDGSIFDVKSTGGKSAAAPDGRTAWRKLAVPYEGSLFGVVPLGGKSLLTYGLRGHVYVSEDAGATWELRPIPVPILIQAGLRLKSGLIVLGGLGGNFFLSRDGGHTFEGWKPAAYTGGVAGLLETADGALLAAGELGVVRLQVPVK